MAVGIAGLKHGGERIILALGLEVVLEFVEERLLAHFLEGEDVGRDARDDMAHCFLLALGFRVGRAMDAVYLPVGDEIILDVVGGDGERRRKRCREES